VRNAMNAIEKGLRRGIPLEKAASFFINLKSGGRQMSAEDDALMAAAIKQAHVAPPVVPAPPPPPPSLKEASARLDALIGKYKTAGEDGMPAGSEALAAPKTDSKDPAGYLQAEMDAQAVEDQNSVAYYQQCLEQLRLSTAEAEQRAADAEMRAQELEAQQQSHESQMAATQQEMQIAHAAAMQQVEQANALATQAMSGQVEASNQALQAKATETTAKIQGQQLRTHLFDLAAEGLPGTEPDLGGAGGATEGVEPLAAGEAPVEGAGDPTSDAGAEGDTATGEASPSLDDAGQPIAAGGQESVAGGNAGADTGGAGMGAPPSAANASGAEAGTPDAGATPEVQPQSPPKPTEPKQPGVSIKVGSAEHMAKIAAGLPDYLRRPEIVGALAGGAVGAGLTGAEAAGGGGHLNQLRDRVAAGEEATKQPGVKGFAQAFELAKDKALLTLGEATQNHPIAATITGGLAGAGVGYGAGPQLKGLVSEAVAHHKG
jgi:hypothetical protein